MVVSGRPNLVYSPGPGLWSLVLGPFGPDLGPDLALTWDLDLDLSLTIIIFLVQIVDGEDMSLLNTSNEILAQYYQRILAHCRPCEY